MSVRRVVWLNVPFFLAIAVVTGCKRTPPASTETPTTPSATASASAPTKLPEPSPEPTDNAYFCNAEGLGAPGQARQILLVEGDSSKELRALVQAGLCQRDAALQACFATERTEGRKLVQATFSLPVINGAVSGVEGGTEEIRPCLSKALVGSPAGVATGLSLTYVPGLVDRPHPNVRATDVKLPEGITAEAAAGPMRAKNAVLRACYEMALKDDAKLTGTVLVAHELDKQGKASKTVVKAGTLHHASFEKCVEKRLGSLVFPEPRRRPAKLTYTLVFMVR